MNTQLIGTIVTLVGIIVFLVKALQKNNEHVQEKYNETLRAISEHDQKNYDELLLTLTRISGLMRMMLTHFNSCQEIQSEILHYHKGDEDV